MCRSVSRPASGRFAVNQWTQLTLTRRVAPPDGRGICQLTNPHNGGEWRRQGVPTDGLGAESDHEWVGPVTQAGDWMRRAIGSDAASCATAGDDVVIGGDRAASAVDDGIDCYTARMRSAPPQARRAPCMSVARSVHDGDRRSAIPGEVLASALARLCAAEDRRGGGGPFGQRVGGWVIHFPEVVCTAGAGSADGVRCRGPALSSSSSLAINGRAARGSTSRRGP